MSKKAKYNGMTMNVLSEDDKFVTLEAMGMKVRVAREGVMFDKEPEEELVKERKDLDILPNNEVEDSIPSLDDIKDNDILDPPEEKLEETVTYSMDGIRQELEKLKQKGASAKLFSSPNASEWLKFAAPTLYTFFKETGKYHNDGKMNNEEQHDTYSSHFKELQKILSDIFGIHETDSYDIITQLEAGIAGSLKEELNQLENTKGGTTDFPDYPNVGVDTSIVSAEDRRKQNIERRKEAVSMFKSKLKGMLEQLNEYDDEDDEPIDHSGWDDEGSGARSEMDVDEAEEFALNYFEKKKNEEETTSDDIKQLEWAYNHVRPGITTQDGENLKQAIKKEVEDELLARHNDKLSSYDGGASTGGLYEDETLYEAEEGIDIPYESFNKFMEDLVQHAKSNGMATSNEISLEEALSTFFENNSKFIDPLVKKLGGLNKVLDILSKKFQEMGINVLDTALAEEGTGSPAGGGNVMPSNVNGPGTTSDSAVPYKHPIGLGLNSPERRKEKLDNIKE